MAEFDVLHDYGEELERRAQLRTFPIGLKLLKSEADIPEGAERPLRDFGYQIDLCQCFSMSRREGQSIAVFKEDMWCHEPVLGYGWAEPPQFFLDGHSRFPEDVIDLAAGKNYANDFPRLETGTCAGAVMAPLTKINFEPDVVIIYCNSAQMTLLLLGREYEDGHDLRCSLSSHAACVYAIVPAIKSEQCQVAFPCRGDRYRAGAADEEIILAIPTKKLGGLMAGLRHVEKCGSRFPRNIQMRIQPEQRESYTKLSKMMGIIKE